MSQTVAPLLGLVISQIFETNEGTNVTVGLQYSSTGSLIFSKPTRLIFSLLEFMLSSRIYLIPFWNKYSCLILVLTLPDVMFTLQVPKFGRSDLV